MSTPYPRCTCAETNATGATSWGYRCEACTEDAPLVNAPAEDDETPEIEEQQA